MANTAHFRVIHCLIYWLLKIDHSRYTWAPRVCLQTELHKGGIGGPVLDGQTQRTGSMALPSLSPGVGVGWLKVGGGVPALLREADGSFRLAPREPGAQAC